MEQTPRILVIAGSTRARRISPAIAAWVAELGAAAMPAATLEVVDLKDFHLPMDDEPGIPARHGYTFDHTKAWSAKVASGDAFIIVSPQYNWGYPAPLKNALDHVYKEWAAKPAMIVTYGSRGGVKCAAQLREVFNGLHMHTLTTAPALKLPPGQIEANEGHIDPAAAFADQQDELRQAFTELTAALQAAPAEAAKT